MLYLGGKGRAGKYIAEAILAHTTNYKEKTYVEPFLGGGNAFKHIAPNFKNAIASDIHPDLMMCWEAVRSGWVPPTSVSEEEYKAQQYAAPSAIRGFVGYGCSFGGKFFGGFARSKQNVGNYYANHASNSLVEISKHMTNTHLECCSFDWWNDVVDNNCVVYCDPPYANTTGYKNKFNSEYFWQIVNGWCDIGATVFVSEYYSPDGWEPIWEKSIRRKVSGGTGKMTTEKLFVRK